jgi:ATP-binding cassette subfamily B (MDR/TAP) protein 1
VAYFDRSENSPGSICARLSSDASAVQQMTGTRLGSVIETLAMFTVAVLLGFTFSLQLTLLASVFIFIVFLIAGVAIVFEAQLRERNDPLLEQASSVNIIYFCPFFQSRK